MSFTAYTCRVYHPHDARHRVKQLGPGECFMIVGGCAQEVRVRQVRLANQPDDATRTQPMPTGSAIEGINAEQRRAYRQAVGASAPRDTIADQALPATDANILTIGNVPIPPLPALVPPAPSIASRQNKHGESEREDTNIREADDMLELGDQA